MGGTHLGLRGETIIFQYHYKCQARLSFEFQNWPIFGILEKRCDINPLKRNGLAMEDFGKFEKDAGERLDLIRSVLAKSPVEMAELLGIGRGSYSHYKTGKTPIPPIRLKPLVDMGFTSDFIYFGVKSGLPMRIAAEIERLQADPPRQETRGRPLRSAN